MRVPWRGGKRIAIAFVTAALISGCVHVRRGIWSTLADATDVVRADVSVSLGTDMGGHLMLTKWAQLKSYSYEGLYRFGLDARRLGLWEEARQDWWIGPKHVENFSASQNSVALIAFGYLGRMMGRAGDPFGCVAESQDEIGVGLHLFVAGFRVGFRPMELADMLGNLVGQDLCNDNVMYPRLQLLHRWHKAKPKEQEPGGTDTDQPAPPVEPQATVPLDMPADQARKMQEATERMRNRMEEMQRRMQKMGP